MTLSWRYTVLPIAVIFSFRLLGLFMLIPVFTIYAPTLLHATPFLIGLALGSYGLSQGLLQIPFGLLSDRFGRKTMITVGLALFALGSILGAVAHSIEWMIVGRIIQGAGAIGSVLMALLADLTSDKDRTKAMAIIGLSIGFSFALAMILSPMITAHYGLTGIFNVMTCLALSAILLLHGIIPTPKKDPFHQPNTVTKQQFLAALKNPHLQRLNVGIFFQHLILTSTFYAVPLLLKQQIHLGRLTHTWQFYLPLMLTAFLLMLPIIALTEKQQKMKLTFVFAVVCITASQCILALMSAAWYGLCVAILLYFVAFNVLEAALPSLVSRQAGIENKGTAMGIYSSSQFLGIFAGGLLAGLIAQFGGIAGIFWFNAAISSVWIMIARFLRPYAYELTLSIPLKRAIENNASLQATLHQLKGVVSVSVSPEENMVHLRVIKEQYVPQSAERLIHTV